MPALTDDAQFLPRMLDSYPVVLEVLANSYSTRLQRIIRRHLSPPIQHRTEPAEVLQDVWCRLLHELSDKLSKVHDLVDNPDDLLAYLCAVARNEARRVSAHFTAQKRDVRREIPLQSLTEEEHPAFRSPSAPAQAETSDFLDFVLRQFGKTAHEVLELRRCGFTLAEVAAHLGISERVAARTLRCLESTWCRNDKVGAR